MTLRDIAKLANTSVSTVSRSLNDSELVAPTTKARIKAIAETHGFEFNAMARGLVTRTVGTIGIILPDRFDRFDVQLYHAALHNELRRSLERADVDMIVAFRENRYTGERTIERLVTRKKVDGLIMVQWDIDPDTRAFLQERRVPFVLTQYPPGLDTPPYHVVYSDNRTGGRLVAEHLIARGDRRFAIIDGGDEPQSRLRVDGFHDGLAIAAASRPEEAPFETIHATGEFETVRAYHAVRDRIDEIASVDAIFAVNDLMAFGALQALREAGVAVPADIAVVGYDDTPLAHALIPALSSVHQSREEIAQMACEILLHEIARAGSDGTEPIEPRSIGIRPQLVIRESSASPTTGIHEEEHQWT